VTKAGKFSQPRHPTRRDILKQGKRLGVLKQTTIITEDPEDPVNAIARTSSIESDESTTL
jgi:hypothetical protein